MVQICCSPNNKNYKSYGGRGITVCKEWENDLRSFIEYVDDNLGERPEGYRLGRVDVNGNYEPGNIRWERPKTQQTPSASLNPYKSKTGVPYVNEVTYKKVNKHGEIKEYTYYCPVVAGKRLGLFHTLQQAMDFMLDPRTT